MSVSSRPRFISAAEILEPSSRFPVILQDESMPPFAGIPFSSYEDAIEFKTSVHPDVGGKIEVPLELPMQGAFRIKDPDSRDRPSEDFRIVLADREVAPELNKSCSVMPYVLYNGMTSVALRVEVPAFEYDGFWLNIFEPGYSQPFSGVTDAILQVIVNKNEQPAPEVLSRYLVLKEKAGEILSRVINTNIAAENIDY